MPKRKPKKRVVKDIDDVSQSSIPVVDKSVVDSKLKENNNEVSSNIKEIDEISTYTLALDKIFSIIVKKYNVVQLSNYDNNTYQNANTILTLGGKLLSAMKLHVRKLETILMDCKDFVDEVIDDSHTIQKEEEYVYHTKNGLLSYPDRELLVNLLEGTEKTKKNVFPTLDKTKNESITQTIAPPLIDTSTRIIIPEVGYSIKVPTCSDIKNIPSSMYYYKGDAENPSGLYMNILNNNIVKIPFPEIIDSKNSYDRTHSIRCKYSKKSDCDNQRNKMAKLYNSTLRLCNFAHEGDKIVKIGYPSRCPSVPDFGNLTTISTDIKKVTITDVQNMLMYGLNDIISSVIWLDYNSIKDQNMNALEKA
jgi:hypothetical protein